MSSLPEAIRAAQRALLAIDVPEDAPPGVLDMLRWIDYHLREAGSRAGMALDLLETLRELSSEDVARIIDEVKDEE